MAKKKKDFLKIAAERGRKLINRYLHEYKCPWAITLRSPRSSIVLTAPSGNRYDGNSMGELGDLSNHDNPNSERAKARELYGAALFVRAAYGYKGLSALIG